MWSSRYLESKRPFSITRVVHVADPFCIQVSHSLLGWICLWAPFWRIEKRQQPKLQPDDETVYSSVGLFTIDRPLVAFRTLASRAPLSFTRATILRAAILVSLVASMAAQICQVCGQGKEVSELEEIFAFPNQLLISCIQLQEIGLRGFSPLDVCPIFPSLIDTVCGCAQKVPYTSCPYCLQDLLLDCKCVLY